MSGGGFDPDDASVLRLLDPSADGEPPRDRRSRILGVSAHPDDEVFCVGGTLARCAAEGADIEWYPAGSYVIEQGEPAGQLFCLLSGTADVLREGPDGERTHVGMHGPGSFVGEDALASGRPRNAHVVARDDVTCLVLSPGERNRSAGRGADARLGPIGAGPDAPSRAGPSDAVPMIEVDVRPALHCKVAALAAHRSQYAMAPDTFPHAVHERLLGTEYFVVADPVDTSRMETSR